VSGSCDFVRQYQSEPVSTSVSGVVDIDRELYNHGEPDAAYTTGLLLDSIERITNYGANVAEIGVQQALRENAPSS